MAGYTRHLYGLMKKAGAETSQENRTLLDRVIREVLGMPRNPEEEVWEKVKKIYLGPDSPLKKEFEQRTVKLMIKYLLTG